MPRLLPFLALLLLLPDPGRASLYEPLTGFEAGLESPDRPRLTPHPDGGFYGVLNDGGEIRPGLIYRLSPSGGVESPGRLLRAPGSGQPARLLGSLAADAAGRLWGIQLNPSGSGQGSLIRFDPVTGRAVEIAGLDTLPGASWLDVPQSNLAPNGQGGFLFLMGFIGSGAVWHTTLYRLDPVTGGCVNLGYQPAEQRGMAYLTPDGAGFLWGHQGGADGPIFKIDAATGVRTTVVRLDSGGGDGAATRGRHPVADLVADGQGFLWGTTAEGGLHGVGTVFKVEMATGALTTVADLPVTTTDGGVRSTLPVGALCLDGRGWIWGTTSQGGDSSGAGSFGRGTVFKVSMGTGEYRTVVRFTGTGGAFPGASPESNLVLAPGGEICGLTAGGGSLNLGAWFRIDPATDAFTLLHDLSGAVAGGIAIPDTPLVEDGRGLLWGGARRCDRAGTACLYAINPRTGVIDSIRPLMDRTGTAGDGALSGGMVRDGQRRLWGFNREGGVRGLGSVFRVDPLLGAVTVREFTGGTDGRYPSGTPVLDGEGNLWGTTGGGHGGDGAAMHGTVFRISTVSGLLTTVTAFTGDAGPVAGSAPAGGLKPDGLGNLWGVTTRGGLGSLGTVFKVDPVTDRFTGVLEFGALPFPRPERPVTPPTADGRGFMWGGTPATRFSAGGLYRIDTATHRILTDMDSPAGETGELVLHEPDWLWGVTGLGGIFRIHASTHQLQIMHTLTGLTGGAPGAVPAPGALLRGADGHLYGAALRGGVRQDGGPAGGGQIYRVFLGPRVRSVPGSWGTVHPNAMPTDVSFEYGKMADLSDSLTVPLASLPENLSAEWPVRVGLTGLDPSATYYGRVRAVNAGNPNPALGEIMSLTSGSGDWMDWQVLRGLRDGQAGAHADPDGDGLSNVMEYMIGADPLNADDNGRIQLVVRMGAPSLEIERGWTPAGPSPVLYIEHSEDLREWHAVRVGLTTASSGPGVTVRGTPDDNKVYFPLPPGGAAERSRFVRLRVDHRLP